ncbi:hypothetical protein B484DRAFT_444586 [Ochromonadaceae sp. CCMP2298]|nr:hypothetical protein B484DRAFT_444586 [Ochromonadaceae sp. CCMP2298]
MCFGLPMPLCLSASLPHFVVSSVDRAFFGLVATLITLADSHPSAPCSPACFPACSPTPVCPPYPPTNLPTHPTTPTSVPLPSYPPAPQSSVRLKVVVVQILAQCLQGTFNYEKVLKLGDAADLKGAVAAVHFMLSNAARFGVDEKSLVLEVRGELRLIIIYSASVCVSASVCEMVYICVLMGVFMCVFVCLFVSLL